MVLAPAAEMARMSSAIFDLGQGQRPISSTLFSSRAAMTTSGPGGMAPRIRKRRSMVLSSTTLEEGGPDDVDQAHQKGDDDGDHQGREPEKPF